MKRINEKLKLIFLPFLIIAIGFILVYTLLDYILFIRADLFHLREDIVQLWLPLGLAFIPTSIWLRPRLKLLEFRNDNGSFAYLFLAVMAIWIPSLLAQQYLQTSTGKLTRLQGISQYERYEPTRYYTLGRHHIYKTGMGSLLRAEVNGKHNEYMDLYLYITLPIFETMDDTLKGECSYWIGKKYSKTISNRLGSAEKEKKFDDFVATSQQEIANTDFDDFVYLEKAGNTKEHDEFERAIKKSHLIRYKDPVVFKAINEPYEKKNGSKGGWVLTSLAIGSVAWFLFLLIPPLSEEKWNRHQDDGLKEKVNLKESFSLFIPREGYYATPIIMDMNILLFLIMVFSGLGFVSFGALDLLRWGANFGPSINNGQLWRLVTNTFLHGGFLHLAANMYGLVYVGIFLEPKLGRNRFIVIYLCTGIIASLSSIWWHTATVSVGASGAIFGLYGVFIALMLLKVYPQDFNKRFLLGILVFVGFNLIAGFSGGIDNAAHIGGLLSGLLIGVILANTLKIENDEEDGY